MRLGGFRQRWQASPQRPFLRAVVREGWDARRSLRDWLIPLAVAVLAVAGGLFLGVAVGKDAIAAAVLIAIVLLLFIWPFVRAPGVLFERQEREISRLASELEQVKKARDDVTEGLETVRKNLERSQAVRVGLRGDRSTGLEQLRRINSLQLRARVSGSEPNLVHCRNRAQNWLGDVEGRLRSGGLDQQADDIRMFTERVEQAQSVDDVVAVMGDVIELLRDNLAKGGYGA